MLDHVSPLNQSPKKDRLHALIEILDSIPFVIAFEKRVTLFRRYIDLDFNSRNGGGWNPSAYKAKIRRTRVFGDGFAQLNSLGPNFREKIQITFIDQHGLPEAGIDGGGLFKEFLTACLRQAFDPLLGLFTSTKEQTLYPNPTKYATAQDQLELFEFLGRVVGKALYEGVLIDFQFARFFLSKWISKRSYFHDLPSLDPELYKGLLFLKEYQGDFADLSLTMTVDEDTFGSLESIDLVPGGSSISITKENRMKYIYLVSNYKLNVQLHRQCTAFFKGLVDLINPRWLRLFTEVS